MMNMGTGQRFDGRERGQGRREQDPEGSGTRRHPPENRAEARVRHGRADPGQHFAAGGFHVDPGRRQLQPEVDPQDEPDAPLQPRFRIS